MKKMTYLFMVLITLFVNKVVAADITVNIDNNGNTLVSWFHPECVNNKESWGNKSYELKIKKSGSLFYDQTYYADDNDTEVNFGVLEQGQSYKVKVNYYGLRRDCRGLFNKVRTLNTHEFVYDYIPQVMTYPVTLTPDSRRLHHISTGKCLYTNPATTVASSRTHNWGCWTDPNMAFLIEATGVAGEVRLKSQWTNLCIKPVNNNDGGEIGIGSCYLPSTIYKLDEMLPGQYLLRNKGNNKCIYGNNTNGGVANQWGCWNDPNMYFTLETY